MKGMFVILIATVIIGIVIYLIEVFYYRRRDGREVTASAKGESVGSPELPEEIPSEEPHGEICCGKHLVCEKTSLSPMSPEIVYYDDEELDRFAGREAGSYTGDEVEEFREILLTLLPSDAAGWSRSLQLRGITLPTEIREELLMIVAEERMKTGNQEVK